SSRQKDLNGDKIALPDANLAFDLQVRHMIVPIDERHALGTVELLELEGERAIVADHFRAFESELVALDFPASEQQQKLAEIGDGSGKAVFFELLHGIFFSCVIRCGDRLGEGGLCFFRILDFSSVDRYDLPKF